MDFRTKLAAEFHPYGNLTDSMLDRLESHWRLLRRWNPKLNLTRIENLVDVVRLHYCEGLYVATQLPPGPAKVVDIGSGGGFPGIPMAILRPELEMTLVESHQRKAVFLREATRDLANVTVIAGRAEALRLQFDWAVSRAVSPGQVFGMALAPRFAVLLGGKAADAHGGGVRLPWGTDRFLVCVSRGT